ncbi:predicted protein [Histoplasma capsulatum G186AR]|uniref:Uncharacterized protein n=1 Tax=Ajellomyces capsulatus (strain G186AR / H82 / ATCC MYA-2454 / RMSCC 2432) TaxID=447093 RepID=C0NX71_AJECG|nr:uncharacterized protein HCBG_08063 [Histoplasma capsulatum G186AR]EEH03937.1 predicted protein [Histoplasma capsulatum G186AR]
MQDTAGYWDLRTSARTRLGGCHIVYATWLLQAGQHFIQQERSDRPEAVYSLRTYYYPDQLSVEYSYTYFPDRIFGSMRSHPATSPKACHGNPRSHSASELQIFTINLWRNREWDSAPSTFVTSCPRHYVVTRQS